MSLGGVRKVGLWHMGRAWRLLRRLGWRALGSELVEAAFRSWTAGTAVSTPRVESDDLALSIVVPTRNGGVEWERFLQSLATQRRCRWELLVVDSQSVDGTAERAMAAGAQVVSIAADRFTHASSRNAGIALARFPLVFLTVQDAEFPDPLWLHRLCQIFVAESLAALSVVEEPKPTADAWARREISERNASLRLDSPRTLVYSRPPFTRRLTYQAASISHVACLYRREELLGHPLEGAFGEDLRMGLWLIRKRARVGNTSALRILHSHTRNAFYILKRQFLSSRLMVEVGLARPAGLWTPNEALALLSGLRLFFRLKGSPLQNLDPELSRWVEDILLDFPPCEAVPSDLLEWVDHWGGRPEVSQPVDLLKGLVAQVGGVFGAVRESEWDKRRRNQIEALAKEV